MNITQQNARYLRNNMTKQERKLWTLLRKRNFHGVRFLRQYPIGKYIIDFVCLAHMLVIEIDGGQHNEENHIEYDKLRTKYLNAKGYKVLQFWNCDIDNNIEGVYLKISQALSIK